MNVESSLRNVVSMVVLWRRLGVLAILALGLINHSLAQTLNAPTLSPAVIVAGSAVTVRVTARVDLSQVIAGSVNVQRLGANGQATVLGPLNDAGADTDLVAGDGIYSGRVTLAESGEGNVSIRASAAQRGILRRAVSTASLLAVVPIGAPTTLARGDADQQVIDVASGEPIAANSVNACFTEATTYTTVVALSSQIGGTVVGRYPWIRNCYQLRIVPGGAAAIAAAISALSSRPEVRYAEPEPIVSGTDVCSGPVCSDVNYTRVLTLPQVHSLGLGTGAKIGVLDTGLDVARIPTASFNAVLGGNFSNTGAPGNPLDDNGHGTLVAHIAQSTAPGSQLVIVKVLNARKRGLQADVITGMVDADRLGARIMNFSFGDRLQTFQMREFLAEAVNMGYLLIAGAGNSGNSIRVYPAAHIGVVAVGSVSSDDSRASHSNYGPWVNIAAPGVNIGGFGDDGTGTSFAAPFVTGAAALMAVKFPRMNADDVKNQLYKTALPIPEILGLDDCPNTCNQGLGNGRLDLEAALGAVRITRSTAVNAPGARLVRTIEVSLSNATTQFYSGSRSFLGQSTGCEVATVADPPCISNVPYDFAALPAGTYQLRLSFRDPAASFFGSVKLNMPSDGSVFTSVRQGTASIAAGGTKADFSLFGFSSNTVILDISKR